MAITNVKFQHYYLDSSRRLEVRRISGRRGSHDVQNCQKRSSTVCMVMNKLPSHPPAFILTPSRRSTLICIYHPDLIPSSYIINYMTYYCFRMPIFLSRTPSVLPPWTKRCENPYMRQSFLVCLS
jgi:hypothetical protein